MRGDTTELMMSLPEDSVAGAAAVTDQLQATPTQTTATRDAMSWNSAVGSLSWALLLLALYAFWGYWDEKKSVGKSFEIGELKANLSNFVKVTLIVVIGINLINVFLTKVASLRIPVVSKVAGAYLPLFSI